MNILFPDGPMSGLTNQAVSLLLGIAEAPMAWSRPIDLAVFFNKPPSEVLDELADLEAGGWIQSWESCPGGAALTLSPIAAELLGVRLIEVDSDLSPIWAKADRPDPPSPRAIGVFRNYGTLGLVVDPRPGPVELAIAAEEAAKAPARALTRREKRGLLRDLVADRMAAEEARATRKARRRSRFRAG